MRSYVTPWATGGAVPVAVVREPKLTAGGAGRYSMVVIDCSSLRLRLRRAVEAGRRRYVGHHHDRADQATPLVVADVGVEPVVAGAGEAGVDGAPGAGGQPDPLAVTVARHERAVGVLVVVQELDVELATVGQQEDRGVPDQLVGDDPDHGAHASVRPLLRLCDVPGRQQPAQRRVVLLVQPEPADHLRPGRCEGRHGPHLLVGVFVSQGLTRSLRGPRRSRPGAAERASLARPGRGGSSTSSLAAAPASSLSASLCRRAGRRWTPVRRWLASLAGDR